MLALIIFLLTLLGILTRPFKLKIWVFSSVGAVACIALKLVSLQDLKLIFSLIWDSCLTLHRAHHHKPLFAGFGLF